jgi:hypothetical protein
MNYLASPPLVIAYALAGSMNFDFDSDALGTDTEGNDVFLKDIWPDADEVQSTIDSSIDTGMFTHQYAGVFDGDERCIETCVATNSNQVVLAGEKIREADMSGLLAPAASVARGVEHAGLIAFDGATPVLVEGTVEDLTAAFAVYGQTCTHDGHGRGVGSVTFPAAKASAFIAEPGEGGVLVPARESLTREYVALLNEKVEGLDFDYPQPGYSNVMPTGWSKATGAALLAERMGIGLDQVVVFGDAGNDLPMFEAVPNSVAVANATDEAAAAARWHIGRCEDDAVALAIEALVAGEWPFES